MKAELMIKCDGCGQRLGAVKMDTADMPEGLQGRVNAVILAHRENCRYYGGKEAYPGYRKVGQK